MATNRIKGITIEIGGDTTKLDKALAGTNKQLTTTQKSLKDVERLLKLDPGNTELLEQKQRLLAQAAEASAQKLDTLRQAAQSADQALQRGQAYQEKYEPLKAELDGVAASMKGLEANAASMQAKLETGTISTEQYDAFTRKLEETRKKHKDLQQAVKDLDREFSGARMDQGQYDALQRELAATEREMKDLETQAKNSNSALKKFGDGAQEVAGKASAVHDAMMPVTGVIGGVAAAAVATIPATEELRTGLSLLDNNARNVGVGVDAARQAFTDLNTVSGELDSSVEAVSNLLQAGFTESNLQIAVEGLANAATSFPDTIKIESLADSLQETLATGQATGQFGEILDRVGYGAENFSKNLALCTTEAQKQQLALSVLVDGQLKGSYEGWRQNNEELVKNRETSLELQTEMAELAETLLPLVTQFTELATGMLDWFNGLSDGGKIAIGVVLLLVAAIGPVAGIVSSVSLALTAASAANTMFAATGTAVSLTLGQWAIIIGVVIAAVLALVAAIALLTGKSKDIESVEIPEVPTGDSTPRRQSRSMAALFGVPALATGAVVPPNDPFLAVLGDNKRETEVVAPYSTLKQAAGDAFAERGGGGTQAVHLYVHKGGGLMREFKFSLDSEAKRQGMKLTEV